MPSPSAQLLTANTGIGVVSAAITSTKVRIESNNAVHYSVGVAPQAYTANCEVIPSNTVRYINMEGVNNKISLVCAVAGTAALVSIVNCGYVNGANVTY